MLVWRWIRRHAAIPILVLVVVVLALSWSSVMASKEKGTFELVDLQGDRSAIADVSIGGVLGDKAHHTIFTIDGGKVRSSTSLKTATQDDRNLLLPGFGRQIGGWRYEIYAGPPYEIRRYNGTEGGAAYVSVPIHGSTRSFANTTEYGIAGIGDRVFFVVTSTKDYTGTSGIYELDFSAANEDNRYRGESRQLVSFSLDKNAKADRGSSGIQVFGLETVGDLLVLVLEEDGHLVFRGYDSTNGAPAGEVTIEGYVSKPESLNTAYRAFVDEDERVLNVRFEAQPVPTVFSIGATDEGLKLLARTDLDRMEGMVDRDYYYPSKMAISYCNGKLYVLKTVTEIDETSEHSYRLEWPIHLFIEAYESSQLVYRGELRTDANDDTIRLRSPTLREVGYSIDENRQFGDLRIGKIS